MPRDAAEAQLVAMLATMRHESFYVTGTFVDERLGVYVGWVARKGSFADSMPLRNARHNSVLVFSGEEYPQPDRISSLQHRGHWDADRPSYLLHEYEDDPTSFPVRLNGRFHGLMIDKASRTATLFNDRYGIHRLYYHDSKEAFYFGAEAKAILKVCPPLRSLSARGLGEFLSNGCVLENRTLFEGLHVLPGASAWTFRCGLLAGRRTYFEPREWEESATLEPEAYYQSVRQVFARTLPRYFNGHQPIGLSVTGGVDTRLILAWQRPADRSLPSYTFGGVYRDCQDVLLGRRLAHLSGQPHEVIRAGKDFLANFGRYAERAVYLTDGCADVSRSAVLYANEKAREIAPVRMTGNYAGEILRGLRAFKPEAIDSNVFSSDLLVEAERARRTFSDLRQCHPLSFIAFRQVPWHHYGLLALEESQISLRSPFLDNDLVSLAFRAPTRDSRDKSLCIRLIRDGDAALLRIRTDRGHHPGTSGRLTAALTKRFLEFTFKAEYAYDYGMPTWLARIDQSLSFMHLERLFLGRHKYYHFRVWYRDELACYVRDVLLDSRSLSRPYIERKGLQAMVEAHVRGSQNFTREIHKTLTLELLHRSLIDQS
jgi:asparagine synthase (glutamine-hydrolysing)